MLNYVSELLKDSRSLVFLVTVCAADQTTVWRGLRIFGLDRVWNLLHKAHVLLFLYSPHFLVRFPTCLSYVCCWSTLSHRLICLTPFGASQTQLAATFWQFYRSFILIHNLHHAPKGRVGPLLYSLTRSEKGQNAQNPKKGGIIVLEKGRLTRDGWVWAFTAGAHVRVVCRNRERRGACEESSRSQHQQPRISRKLELVDLTIAGFSTRKFWLRFSTPWASNIVFAFVAVPSKEFILKSEPWIM